MRAIDADALSDWMKDYGQKCIKGEREISLMYVWKHIQDMPTIEPERKKGEWEMVSQHENPPTYIYSCSECRHKSFGFYNYCPNCGAEMEDEG